MKILRSILCSIMLLSNSVFATAVPSSKIFPEVINDHTIVHGKFDDTRVCHPGNKAIFKGGMSSMSVNAYFFFEYTNDGEIFDSFLYTGMKGYSSNCSIWLMCK